jgi:hypothetical protein
MSDMWRVERHGCSFWLEIKSPDGKAEEPDE